MLGEAVEASRPFTLALIDLYLPDMDGESLGRQIKERSNLAQTLLILSAPQNERDRAKKMITTLFSAYLIKPLHLSRLQAEIRMVISGQPRLIHSGEAFIEANIQPFEPEIISQPSELSEPNKSATLKILIAEDNVINQKVAISQLKNLGYVADIADNGEEALQCLAQVDYDIVFMDCQMPVLDGYSATRELRQREKQKQHHTIVIAMTASAMQEDRDQCLEAGMDDFLSKPVRKEDLMAMLERWINPESQELKKLETTEVTSSSVIHLDQEYLHQLSDNDTDFEQELLQVFIHNLSNILAKSDLALQNQDFQTIAANAHQLKGSSGNIGAANLHHLFRDLEEQARQQNLETTHLLLQDIEQALIQFSTYIKAHYSIED
jgi:CheY-like chemotaxis protein